MFTLAAMAIVIGFNVDGFRKNKQRGRSTTLNVTLIVMAIIIAIFVLATGI